MTDWANPWSPTDLVVYDKSGSIPVVGQFVFPPPKEANTMLPLPEMVVKLVPRPHPAWKTVKVIAVAHPAGDLDGYETTTTNNKGVEVGGEDALYFVFNDISLPQIGDCGLFFAVYVDNFEDRNGNTDALAALGPAGAAWKMMDGYILGTIDVPLVKGIKGFVSHKRVAAHERQTELTPEGARKWTVADFARIKAIIDAQAKVPRDIVVKKR